ncbi:MAG TPA: hypothetical protein VGJ34_08920 [Gaiellaceae bacterium]
MNGNLTPVGAGNTLALKHGATAVLRLAPRAAEITDELRSIVPATNDSDEPAIRLLALILARIEAANEWLAENGLVRGKGDPQGILKALSTWENSASRLLERLGCMPTSRASLGLDISRMRAISPATTDLGRLSVDELGQLHRLLSKVEVAPDVDA